MGLIEEKYYGTVGTAVAAATGIAVPGIFVPTLDMAGVGATWTVMIGSIADKSGQHISPASVAKVVAAAVSAVSAYMLGSKILTWAAAPLILAFPFAGVPAAVAVNAMLNGLFTLKLGITTAKQFSRPDFNSLDILNVAETIAGALVKLPSTEEIKLVKKMLEAF
ncbi:MAG: hypothetical protein ACREXR_09860 [Gammaproteobacteria bacterium]